MQTALIAVGIIVFIKIVVFLYLLVAGTDESRKRKNRADYNKTEPSNEESDKD